MLTDINFPEGLGKLKEKFAKEGRMPNSRCDTSMFLLFLKSQN